MSRDDTYEDVTAWLRTRPRRAALPYADRSRPLLVSSAQRRLWFDHQLRSQKATDGGTVYHSTLALRLRENIDVAALRAALTAVTDRHEALRSHFSLTPEGELCQLVDDAGTVDLHIEDLTDAPGTRRARMAEFFAAEFDLEHGPLLRAGLFSTAPRDHVLLLVIHHIVTDGWSMDLLHQELAELYEAHTRQRPAELRDLAYQYADFAAWEQSDADGGIFAEDLAYWQQQLAGAPQVIDLPADMPRPGERTYAGGCHRFAVPPAVVSRIEQVARDCEASTFQVLFAAYQLLLARWTGRPDLIVGSVAANRRSAATEPIIGLFANVLPVRGHIDESESFARLVGRTRDTVLDAYDHQGVSFDRIVEAVAPARQTGHSPLVQTVFTLAEAVPGAASEWGERVEFRDTTRTQFDLSFAAGPDGSGGLLVDAHFAADLLRLDSVERLARRFVALLDEVSRRPGEPLSRFATVTAEEAAELERFATGTPGTRTTTPTVLDLFERQVRERPHQEAVTDGTTRLTYAELGAEVERIARLITSRGLAPATPVGVCLTRSASQVAALLGVLRAGAVYLPLDPAYPADRLTYLLRDAGCPLVLKDANTPDLPRPAHVELLDVSTAAPADAPAEIAPVRLGQPAYLIYTSGSTGQPKGVLVTHEGIGNFVSWYVDHYGLTPDDRLPQLASPGFDASLLDTLPALAAGAVLAVLPDEARLDPGGLWSRLDEAGVTVAFLTTPLFAAAAAEPPTATGLRAVQTGGDSLAHVPAGLPFTLDNLYGPTECTIAATSGRLDPGLPVHIGGPLRGMRARVLDDRLRRVPVGTPGELFLAGPGIALGYLGRPGLTATRFLPDPWASDGGRIYRTGDRARRCADGRLEYLGRTDAQLKIRGHRIEPGEIEAVLSGHPGVREAAVEPRTAPDGEAALCAYVSLRADVAVAAVREHAERALPAWMRPAAYTVLPELPLTANGKVDRAALPHPEFRTAAAYRPPSGPVQELVAEVWQEVLGLDRVGADDDFFRIGGHSLLATRVLSRLSDATGCRLPLRAVFDHPVLESLAHEVEETVISAAMAAGEGID
ncbi:amino acid adenylation domain-containing protein [Streptomyces sp. NPDC047117]|uniref:non-ribosomal peptide synthetase n=1 Tax=Streptomyces sp. NPDC047117 TaxID=3155379 RepID=UPI0033DA9398